MGDKRTSPRASPKGSPKGSPRIEKQDDVNDPEQTQQEEPLPQSQGLLHGNALIEAGGSDEDGEFSASDFDADSIAGNSDSTSIGSSIYEHSFQNGRRYHRYRHGRYPLPNDEAEQNREDMLHAMMLEATDGRLCYAPIGKNPQNIAGTGIWAIEMGDKYPSAEVLGLDLSPIQPCWVPPNVKSWYNEYEWLNGGDFDFVHLRNMITILKSPVLLLKQAYACVSRPNSDFLILLLTFIRNMKPGAWVELQDVDGQVHTDDDTIPEDWPLNASQSTSSKPLPSSKPMHMPLAVFGGQYLAEAGFVNIQHNYIKLPYGTWPKDK
ncbi:uncharacterized protein NECHADRAFT_83604 [Fusarium vanettenii 77-13-4]|uniref:Methyltransferase domain-containing protein n=1 Tax=Fusarium vanettenii (strain ATCC MYA-4622 / CBS 123669 / FGSC 9596 / NRRL 45880 / 77-13-4) TaxID=660122 RepID=C7YY86_FUSV7|nr:uncharacterized protein NECHADRAFT_83604 [Fusarium vanettenii 77-13-4]EEU43145.1 hypothetical protein NECHADRAFT_83604 [Fusarium vanettenii 77-13-4]